MFQNARNYLASFFPSHIPLQLRELYVTVSMANLAVSAVLIFEPIYLYKLGYSIPAIIGFYGAIYILYFLLMPFGAAACLRWGHEKIIFLSSIFLVGYYASFIGLSVSAMFLPLAILTEALQKIFYWPSFYYAFSLYGRDEEEGREVGNLHVLDVIVSAIGPFLGGLLLLTSNFTTLFVAASVMTIIAHIPLLVSRVPVVPQKFPALDCFKRLVDPEKRGVVLSFIGYGEEFVSLILWPLFIYIVFVNDLFSLGSLMALTTTVTVLVLLYVGRLTDQTNKREVLRTTSVLYSFLWVMRLFLGGLGSVFMIDTMSRLTKRMLQVPQFSILFERARHRHHIMATSVLFEMSLVVGKLLAILVLGIAFIFWPSWAWSITFIMAALFSLLYVLL